MQNQSQLIWDKKFIVRVTVILDFLPVWHAMALLALGTQEHFILLFAGSILNTQQLN